MSWSADGQTPEFLAATRMVSLGDAIVKTVLGQLRLQPGMRVLDVGCGSGEYCLRLGSATSGVSYTGLEYDAAFVDFANERVAGTRGYPFEQPNPANSYRFACGDGLDLPFEDGSFDAVVSHTYLTAVPDWACALAEMCRVCKPGGTVSSITSMTGDFYGTGTIGLFTGLFDDADAELLRIVESAKAAAFGHMDLASGMPPRKAPVAFDWIGLENVRCTPLAHYACLSDAGTGRAFKQRYVDLLYATEAAQLQRLKGHPEASGMLSGGQWDAYERLMKRRRDELAGDAPDREWNWYGNASLLVCGTVPGEGADPRWTRLRDASRQARASLSLLSDAGVETSVRMKQLGPGRCARATVSAGGMESVATCGFDPPRAVLEACGKVALKARLAGALQGLAGQERKRLRAEGQIESRAGGAFPKLADGEAFRSSDVWEAVSDAALAGTGVVFEDAGEVDGMPVIACEATSAGKAARAVAAHADRQEAIRRAFARAVGNA